MTPEQIAELVRCHTETLLRAAYGLGFYQSDAEELVQDCFVAFLEAAKRFKGRSSIKTFLFGILYNKARELRRRRTREEAVDPTEAAFEARFNAFGVWNCIPRGPEAEVLSEELRRIMAECSESLSTDQRAALYLRVVEGESTETVCNILDVSSTHLGVILFRARNRLRECLERKWK